MSNIVVAGATGFIGKSLVKALLDQGHSVTVLSRKPFAFRNMPTASLQLALWDGRSVGGWAQKIDGADAVINLAGEGIADKRWTENRKHDIKASRVESTRAIVEAIIRAERRPKTLINASAVGYYGDVPRGDVSESHPKGKGFLADTCSLWEGEALNARGYGVRVVLTRFGVVIAEDGGALKKFILPFKLFVGGPLGSGRQWFPWVHRDDVIGAILFALENTWLSGPVNVTAPEAVTMKDLCKALGKALHRPSWVPVPGFMLHLLLGEMAGMLLTGQNAVPTKLQSSGYSFRYPALSGALSAALRRHP